MADYLSWGEIDTEIDDWKIAAMPRPKRKLSDIPEDAPISPVRIDDELQMPLRKACKKDRLGPTRLVNQAIREFLIAHGFLVEESRNEEPA